MNWKEYAIFVALFFVASWLSTQLLPYVSGYITDPTVFSIMITLIPASILFIGWQYIKKKKVA